MERTMQLLLDAVKRNDYKSFCEMHSKVRKEEIISFKQDRSNVSKEWSLLHYSARFTNGEDTRIFLKLSQMIDLNTQNKNGSTPLFIASQEGHCEVVKALMDNPKVNPNLAQNGNFTPLYIEWTL
eukprot:TRINITY_DN485_c0_g1_i5.p1 TRINITY_DN485_c0_g1~~TRINITY_DN485_c0_g1_i5.p1  ORF type:complete len:125 (+),score=36.49 TRINITY_DN485_c0_g1_i5:317-691(+)